MPACTVKRVIAVEPFPQPDVTHVSIVRTGDAQFVSGKTEDGSPRYAVGDLVIHIVHGSVLTDEMMVRLDTDKRKIRAGNYKSVRSEGMLLPASEVPGCAEGDDVTAALNITF
jgi:tRNA-binding EMAP/Myf-like protein